MALKDDDPPESKSEPAKAVTDDEFETWIGAAHVFQRLKPLTDGAILQALLNRLSAGLVRAVAGTAVVRSGETRTLYPIPADLWQHAQDIGSTHSLIWKVGEALFARSGTSIANPSVRLHMFDIRFEPSGIDAIRQKAPRETFPVSVVAALKAGLGASVPIAREDRIVPIPAAEPAAALRHPGGRPPKPWWDDLWVEVCRQIYVGDLTPDKQASIQKAMLDWAARCGHDMSDATAKNAARKLFKALNGDG